MEEATLNAMLADLVWFEVIQHLYGDYFTQCQLWVAKTKYFNWG